jgi:hypothetical protein
MKPRWFHFCRLGLNNPPTAVGGIFKLNQYYSFQEEVIGDLAVLTANG